MALGVSVGVGARSFVVGTGGSGGPGGVLVVLRPGCERGLGGARAYADTLTGGYRVCLGVGLRPMAAVVVGHLLDVGRHQGFVWGWGLHWLPLVLLRPGRGGRPVVPGCCFLVVWG